MLPLITATQSFKLNGFEIMFLLPLTCALLSSVWKTGYTLYQRFRRQNREIEFLSTSFALRLSFLVFIMYTMVFPDCAVFINYEYLQAIMWILYLNRMLVGLFATVITHDLSIIVALWILADINLHQSTNMWVVLILLAGTLGEFYCLYKKGLLR